MAVITYGTPTILVLDEMQVMLDTVAEMLEKHYHVIGVTNFGALLKALSNYNPSLFLLDTELSKTSFYPAGDAQVSNGFDVAKQIRKMPRFTKTQILFMTEIAKAETITNAIKSGGGGVIIKPPSKVVLLGKIHYLLSPVTVTIEQTEKVLTGETKFSQLAFSMLITRMKTLYVKYPTKETLQTFAEEITEFIEKSKVLMAADYETIGKL
ncbi:MAG: response regulator [Treponema sp.]|jgi:CheY-like chemotaxis protein|nr:response regulator [Treponema sp.]